MSITYKTGGNIVDESADALVNTVNCVGVMGKGVAAEFKKRFPDNFDKYATACSKNKIKPGEMFIVKTGLMFPDYIVNFPTKQHWRGGSKMQYIEDGLKDLVTKIKRRKVRSIAMPPLGCGFGGLKWSEVRPLIEKSFEGMDDLDVTIFEPQDSPSDEFSYLEGDEEGALEQIY